MSKCIGISTVRNGINTVTTIAFENGQVLEMFGAKDWKEIRPADKYDQGKKIGVCRACGHTLYESDEWNFSTQGEGWTEHALEEDCIK